MNPTQKMITLFISEKSALQAAWLAIEEMPDGNSLRNSNRIIPATMRDKDGTVDQGFKVEITRDGKHSRWL
mgnify:CR=1 FL=1